MSVLADCQHCNHDVATGNDILLLHEIKHALSQLIDENKSRMIDLKSIPLSDLERDNLLRLLGNGEINVKMEALGQSKIKETAISGVWLTTHYNTENDVIAQLLEVTYLPQILQTQPEALQDGLNDLSQLLINEGE